MKRLRALVLGLVGTLITLTPLAYASPPDPVWIAGIYDDDDQDDVVDSIVSATALVEPFVFIDGCPARTVIGCCLQARETLPPHPASSSNQVRAPPGS